MSKVIRLSLNTKFNERGDIGHPMAFDVISIGMANIDKVDDDCYDGVYGIYRVVADFNHAAAAQNPYLHDDVLPKLYIGQKTVIERNLVTHPLSQMKVPVGDYLAKQIKETGGADIAEIWTQDGCYDNTVLSRIFGMRDKLPEFLGGLGVSRVLFKNMNALVYPESPEQAAPSPCASLKGHAFYDAYDQARLIRWAESEERKKNNIPVIRGATLK